MPARAKVCKFASAGTTEVTDITYIATGEGWLYLAGVKDVFTCELAGYAMGPRMTQDLREQVLWRAVRNKRPAPELVHHSDRGSQYCAEDCRKLVEQFGMTASMSRRGNCYDNAPMEKFLGQLEKRNDLPPALCHQGRGESSHQRVHRDFL